MADTTPPAGPTQSTRPAGSTRKTLRAGRPRTRTPPRATCPAPSAQRAGTPSPTASARRAWPGGPRSGAKGRAAALAGNRTRVNCLEGSYAHHYTTNAARPGPARRGRPRVRSAPSRLGALSPPPPPPRLRRPAQPCPDVPPGRSSARPPRTAAARRPSLAPPTQLRRPVARHAAPRPAPRARRPRPAPRARRPAPAPRARRPAPGAPARRPAPGAPRPAPRAGAPAAHRRPPLEGALAAWPLSGPRRPAGEPRHVPGPASSASSAARNGTGPSCLPPERHPRRLRGWAAGRHVAEELAVAAAGTTRGPGCAVATQRPASSHAKGWGRWAVGRPGTRRRTAEKKRPCPSGARGGTQSCAGHQKGRLASPSGNRTPVSRVTGGDTHHYTNEDGGGRPPGRPTPLRLPPHACPCLPPTPCPARAPDTGHAPPDPSPASAPSPARQPPAPTPSPPGPGAHTRTRTALSTPNERCLSLVCQAGIAPGEKAPDGKRGCEGEGEGEGSWGWGCDCDGSRAGGGGGGGGGGGEAAGRAPPGPPRVSRPLRTHTAASRAP
ncbi:translation initiation factor IF-2-like [Lynx canadensis]|uniref:translation initiation factor IF-2-like n=1 Tax=Lynx canadensis TaxID=61383 RepID=UPI0011B06D4D|nr:translation initiation factor IF-2-like [Lynx canadensis]